ncbi:glycogen synthase GlgA [Isosphaeraceae bacterium EP7]
MRRAGEDSPLHIAIVASEAVPFSKTGGLADVAGSLPRALNAIGHRASLFAPLHRSSRQSGLQLEDTGLRLDIPVGPRIIQGSVFLVRLPGTDVVAYLIDQPEYFDRPQLYQTDGVDYGDNCARFVFFCRAVLETVRLLNLDVDVFHCNDWQTGLIPVYLDELYRADLRLGRAGTLMTIHNLAYQGWFWHWDLPLTGLDWGLFNFRQLEHHGQLNFLKAGIVFADLVSTVSPTYAREIQTPAFGCGLEGLLQQRGADLRGIVNGIDTDVWNPRIDPVLAAKYDIESVAIGKAECKAQLQRRASLTEFPDVPLFAQIGRLDSQKGWDLLLEVAEQHLQGDVQVVILGEGSPRYHEALDRLAHRYSGKLRVFLEFSNSLAHQIEAGADLFLMPSLYEPCGLNQLYSQAYGTVPIVHKTGGLADTVVDATPENLALRTATGVTFDEPTPQALMGAIERATRLFRDRGAWMSMVRAGMARDSSWNQSAREYVALYREVVEHRRVSPAEVI